MPILPTFPEEINQQRRRFFGAAAMTIAAGQRGMTGLADAHPSPAKPAQLPADQAGDEHLLCPTEADRCRPLNIGVEH
jgi:hypothetical protein